MFTWICPECGHEVPPSYSECPNCASKTASAGVEQAPAEPAPEEQQLRERFAARRPPAQEPRKPGMPAWLMSLLFALGFVAIGAGAYYGYKRFGTTQSEAAVNPALESPAPAAAGPPKPHPYAKYIEVTGLRLTEDTQKAEVRFVVVNHSSAEIAELSATVRLKAVSRSDQEPVGTFSFKLPSLGPYEIKELKSQVQTKLRVYELPDWQFLRAELEITSP